MGYSLRYTHLAVNPRDGSVKFDNPKVVEQRPRGRILIGPGQNSIKKANGSQQEFEETAWTLS